MGCRRHEHKNITPLVGRWVHALLHPRYYNMILQVTLDSRGLVFFLRWLQVSAACCRYEHPVSTRHQRATYDATTGLVRRELAETWQPIA